MKKLYLFKCCILVDLKSGIRQTNILNYVNSDTLETSIHIADLTQIKVMTYGQLVWGVMLVMVLFLNKQCICGSGWSPADDKKQQRLLTRFYDLTLRKMVHVWIFRLYLTVCWLWKQYSHIPTYN